MRSTYNNSEEMLGRGNEKPGREGEEERHRGWNLEGGKDRLITEVKEINMLYFL